jgi:hypothetical protein
MTVKSLNELQKDSLVRQFVNEKRTKKWLVITHSTSMRTINRILEERGVIANSVLAKKDEYTKVRKIMEQFQIKSPEDLKKRLTDAFTGQAVLGFDEVPIKQSPPVNEKCNFALAIIIEDKKAHVQVSHMIDDVMYVDHSSVFTEGEHVTGFKLTITEPKLDLTNVQLFLNQRTKEELAGLFYTSGLMKIAEMHVGSIANATLKHQEAARAVKEQKVDYGQHLKQYKPV